MADNIPPQNNRGVSVISTVLPRIRLVRKRADDEMAKGMAAPVSRPAAMLSQASRRSPADHPLQAQNTAAAPAKRNRNATAFA